MQSLLIFTNPPSKNIKVQAQRLLNIFGEKKIKRKTVVNIFNHALSSLCIFKTI